LMGACKCRKGGLREVTEVSGLSINGEGRKSCL
jgi:hypothetical protein